MARRSLRPHLNQIRTWVRQGRTDAWVAHQLEVSVQDIEQFKHQNELSSDEDATVGATVGASVGATDYEEIDLRAEDDALIAAELEAAEIEAERLKAEAPPEQDEDEDESEAEDQQDTPRRRRSRRGGRGRRTARNNAGPLEGTFDHGEEGYGLWLDPAVQDNPIYAEHWAGHRSIEVLVEEDRIVISRISTGSDDT
jgi:hypothetical protein